MPKQSSTTDLIPCQFSETVVIHYQLFKVPAAKPIFKAFAAVRFYSQLSTSFSRLKMKLSRDNNR
jgi:hypothetical protein